MSDRHPEFEFDISRWQIDPAVKRSASNAAKRPQPNRYAISLGALVASAWVGETQMVQMQPASDPHEWLGDSGQIVPDGDGD